MTKDKFNVLLVDDHPAITEAYESGLKIAFKNIQKTLNIKEAFDCDSAIRILKKNKNKGLDLVFLDIKIPASSNGKFISGEDLGVYIRENMPKTKIIIATTYNNNYRINSIIKSVDPDGFLIKNDMKSKQIIEAINAILSGDVYYSSGVLKFLRKSIANDFTLDKVDRDILYQLSLGTKTSSLPKIVNLSIAGIEKRKRVLKDVFAIKSKNDSDLIRAAREKGFL